MNSGYIAPGRLGLPDRDYYVEQDAKSKEIREQYKDYISWVLQYAGDDEATSKPILKIKVYQKKLIR